MKRNRVLAGLVVLTLLWAGNIFYFEKHKLKEPVFLKHYYDLTLYGNEIPVLLQFVAMLLLLVLIHKAKRELGEENTVSCNWS